MELHQLRYFVAAADAGSVSKAAARCHVAQPSLSQQLKKLEEHLGVTLFDRLGRGIALTEAGRALLPRARRILAEVRETEANLRREVDEGNGPVTIGAIPTIAPYLLPAAMAQLRGALPSCQIGVTEDFTEHLVEALMDARIDCALVSTPLEHDLLDVDVIAHEELLLVTPAGHPLASTAETSIGSLEAQPTVTLEEMHCLGRQIQGFCASRHVAPRIVCTTAQLATIFELVALGLGVSIVPEMASASVRRPDVAFVRLTPRSFVRQIAVAWRKDRARPRAALRLVDVIKAHLHAGQHRRVAGPRAKTAG